MPELESHIDLSHGDTGSSLLVLQQQVATLRILLAACLAALFSLSLVLIAFLYVQDRLIRRDLAGARQLVLDYETNKKPVINALIVKLQGFAQSHPDFLPILQKYGVPPSAPVQSPQPPASTTPAR